MDNAPRQPIPPVTNWTPNQMLEIAARAVGKIVRYDERAMATLSVDEVAAMTGALIGLGLVAILPGQPTPETLIIIPRKETGQ